MSRNIRILAISALGAALFAATASAQDNYVRTYVTLEERYDDNVSFAGVRNDGENDLVTTVIPQIKFLSDGARTRAGAQYGFEANYHLDNPDLNYIAHNAGVDLSHEITKQTNIRFSDGFSYTKDSLQYLTTGIQLARSNIIANTATASVATRLSKTTDGDFAYTNYILSFDNPELIDSTVNTFSLGSGYMYSSTGAARATYAFSTYDFEDGAQDRSRQSHTLTLGISEKVASSMKASVSGGVVYVPNLDGNDFLFVASAGLEQSYGDSTLTLSYTRQTTNPSGLTSEITVSDRVDFTWGHNVKSNLSFKVFGGLAKNTSEPSGDVDINSYNTGVKGTWQPYKTISVGAGFTHFEQWSKDEFGSSTRRNQVFLNITFTGPEWRF